MLKKDGVKSKGLAILGSTGNIGQQTLEIVSKNPERFCVKILSAANQVSLLIEQAIACHAEMAFIANTEKTAALKIGLRSSNTKVLESEEELYESLYNNDLDLVLLAIVGFAGLIPCLKAIEAGKDIAIANKESLVVGGEIIMEAAKQHNVKIIPVDSEHSAIFQCLLGEDMQSIEKVILTASGGPFYQYSQDELRNVSLKAALKHPTWNMGPKVSIDSASLMNKGLEVIEAKWLFNLKPEQIKVVIHPQSVIHSMVQFTDGSLKAQMGYPNMQHPIHYALHYPQRIPSTLTRFNFMEQQELSFRPVDTKKFRNLALAFEAMEKGGYLPAILNAANEAAVEAFLQENISFLQISEVIETMMSRMNYKGQLSLKNLQITHQEVYEKTKEIIKRIN